MASKRTVDRGIVTGELASASVDYLADGLARIERRLVSDPNRMLWKINVGEADVTQVALARHGDQWRLIAFVEDGGGQGKWQSLSELSVVHKAALAKTLPGFLSSYKIEQQRRSQLITEGLASLEKALDILEGA